MPGHRWQCCSDGLFASDNRYICGDEPPGTDAESSLRFKNSFSIDRFEDSIKSNFVAGSISELSEHLDSTHAIELFNIATIRKYSAYYTFNTNGFAISLGKCVAY